MALIKKIQKQPDNVTKQNTKSVLTEMPVKWGDCAAALVWQDPTSVPAPYFRLTNTTLIRNKNPNTYIHPANISTSLRWNKYFPLIATHTTPKIPLASLSLLGRNRSRVKHLLTDL